MDDIIEIDNPFVEVVGEDRVEIKRYDANTSYQEFFENCLVLNKPAIISLGFDWKCYDVWLTEDKQLDVNYFDEKYGSSAVCVAQCDKKVYNVQEKIDMTMSDYLAYWKQISSSKQDCLYLKDWHFTKDFPSEKVYRVPKLFASDWLSEYYDNHSELNDDYRFVYLGPRGSWTPLHSDVFTSFSWSFNVFGIKRWFLLTPGQESQYRDQLGNLIYDKNLEVIESDTSTEIMQYEGEAIYIPSSWHHQVWNEANTLSINHNWINGANVVHMWASMKDNLRKVENEIDDCKNMEGWQSHCQLMLKALYGFNYLQFFHFIKEIAQARMNARHKEEKIKLYGDWLLGENHTMFDLLRLHQVLRQFAADDDAMKYLDSNDESIVRDFCDVMDIFMDNVT